MSSKKIIFNTEARERLKNGVDALANAVKVTLGPQGRNVVISQKFGPPMVTKDGVTVAKEIELKDPIENMGAQMVKEVASKTNDVAGDGTTTATVLAQAIVREGLKNVTAGSNPMELKRGIDAGTASVVSALKAMSIPVSGRDEIANVGTISSNNDKEIGALIADAMDKVGKDGIITVEEAKGLETTLEIVEGMQFDRGYTSPYFINNPDTMQVEMDNPLILLHEKKISSMKDLVPILEKAIQTSQPILIIAEDVDGEAFATLVVNRVRGSLKIAVVKSPGIGDRRKDILEDIAILTGGEVISEERGHKLESAEFSMLGRAKKVTITKDGTTIIGGLGSAKSIAIRVSQLKSVLEKTDSDYEKEKCRERIAKLAGGVAVLHVGASTEPEMREKKQRVEDALNATKAAVQEGIVPGGGVALVRCIDALNELKLDGDAGVGVNIVRRALEEPLRMIVANSGVEAGVVLQRVLEGRGDFGYNARTETYENMFASGVIDPTKVTRSALENAASIGGLLLTTECVISEE